MIKQAFNNLRHAKVHPGVALLLSFLYLLIAYVLINWWGIEHMKSGIRAETPLIELWDEIKAVNQWYFTVVLAFMAAYFWAVCKNQAVIWQWGLLGFAGLLMGLHWFL